MKPKAKMTARMATFIFHLSTFIFLAACTEDSFNEASSQHPNSPLTITATIPGDVWAVATRAEGEGTVTYSDWTLHYTDYTGQAASGDLTATSSQDGTYTLTTDNDLVWAKVNTTKPMHLTARCDNGTPSDADATDDYTLHTSVPSATAGEELAFPDMKHTLAKFTVNFMFSYNMEQNAPTADDFAVTIDAKKAADSYDPMTHGGTWPIGDGDVERGQIFSQQSAATYTYTVTSSMLLPQQTMGNELIMTYKETSWTLNLNAVAVTGGEEGQMANQLIAGQHLTLNLKAGLTAINTPSDIQIEAFTAADADADDYTPDLGGVAKTYEYDAANYTYYIYHEKFIEAALADRAANNPQATIVYNGLTVVPSELASEAVAVVSGIETDLATVQAAISGKTHIIVTGTELAYYSNGNNAETVVGEAIRTSGAAYGTVSLILPEATSIGYNAFINCTALTNVSAPEATQIWNDAFAHCYALTTLSLPLAKTIEGRAFISCGNLTSVELPAATEIGEGAFYGCKALKSVSLPEATTIGDNAFQYCDALTSLTFGSVIESVGTDAFTEIPTENYDLTLAAGQEHIADDGTPNGTPVTAGETSWAGATWKSITLK